MSESASGETCGFVESEEHLPPDYEEVVCERPVWKYERCIWHADIVDQPEDEKPVDELKWSLEEHDGRIDGARLSGLDAAGITFLSDRELIYADLSGANLEGADLIDGISAKPTSGERTSSGRGWSGRTFSEGICETPISTGRIWPTYRSADTPNSEMSVSTKPSTSQIFLGEDSPVDICCGKPRPGSTGRWRSYTASKRYRGRRAGSI